MSLTLEKPLKVGNEITVRISLTFQEAPDVHTLLAMTPVRERGKLVRLALERYIRETAHPAGNVEQQIGAISTWLRSRGIGDGIPVEIKQPVAISLARVAPGHLAKDCVSPSTAEGLESKSLSAEATLSVSRWLQA